MQKAWLKSLQEDAADDINRQHFQMQVFLAFQGLKYFYNFFPEDRFSHFMQISDNLHEMSKPVFRGKNTKK